MHVVSVSLPPALVDDVDRHAARHGYKGRSEVTRVALRRLLQESPEVQGHVHGSITIAYPHGGEARLSEVRHAFHDVVLSMMHTHCEPETCMDVLLVGGEAKRILDLVEHLRRRRDVTRCIFAPVTSNLDSAGGPPRHEH